MGFGVVLHVLPCGRFGGISRGKRLTPLLAFRQQAEHETLLLQQPANLGGHLIQLHNLKPWWERHDRLWVTFEKVDSVSLLEGEQMAWAYHPTTRNLANLLRNLVLAWRLLRSYRPDVVVSSGAGVSVVTTGPAAKLIT
jgi:hypothetical protein